MKKRRKTAKPGKTVMCFCGYIYRGKTCLRLRKALPILQEGFWHRRMG